MPVLDTLLAFSLTMLVIATVVSSIVKLFHRALGTRRKVFVQMADYYFDRDLKPVINRELDRLTSTVQASAIDAVRAAAYACTSAVIPATVQPKVVKFISELKPTPRVDLKREDLLEYILQSPLGTTLLKELGKDATGVLDALGARYDILCAKVTVSFRNNVRFWSTVFGAILALALNIDSVNIATTYYTNDTLRESTLQQLDATLSAEKVRLGTVPTAAFDSAQQISGAISEIKLQLTRLTNSGIPVGWSQFPYTIAPASGQQSDTKSVFLFRLLLWLLGIIATSVLAGLGAPFWYDMVTGLGKLTRRNRPDAQTP